jgi:hypothetical protein
MELISKSGGVHLVSLAVHVENVVLVERLVLAGISQQRG